MEDLFTPKTFSFLKEAIGGVEILSNKKVITCSIVLSVSEDHLDDLRIANREEDCINPPEDAFLYMFLRAYCASLLGTVSLMTMSSITPVGKNIARRRRYFNFRTTEILGKYRINL